MKYELKDKGTFLFCTKGLKPDSKQLKTYNNVFDNEAFNKNTKGIYSNKKFYKYIKDTLVTSLEEGFEKLRTRINAGVIGKVRPDNTHYVPEEEDMQYRYAEAGSFSEGKSNFWWYRFNELPCHGFLKRKHNQGALAVATLINEEILRSKTSSADLQTVIDYYDFLVKDSPYAPVFLNKDGKEILDNGYYLCRTDVPANVLLAACIAGRKPISHSKSDMDLFTILRRKFSTTPLTKPQQDRLAFLFCIFAGKGYRSGSSYNPKLYELYEDYSDTVLVYIKGCDLQGLKQFVLEGFPVHNLNPSIYFYEPKYNHVAFLWTSEAPSTRLEANNFLYNYLRPDFYDKYGKEIKMGRDLSGNVQTRRTSHTLDDLTKFVNEKFIPDLIK